MTTMTDDEKIAAATSAVEERMLSGEQWTYSQLSDIEYRSLGSMRLFERSRIADKANQRFKKKGWATFTRSGRETVWSLTDAGKAEAERRRAQDAA